MPSLNQHQTFYVYRADFNQYAHFWQVWHNRELIDESVVTINDNRKGYEKQIEYVEFQPQHDNTIKDFHLRKTKGIISSNLHYLIIPLKVHWRKSFLKYLRRLESSGIPGKLFTTQEPFDTSVNPYKRIDDSEEIINIFHLMTAFHIYFYASLFCIFVHVLEYLIYRVRYNKLKRRKETARNSKYTLKR